MGRRGFTLMILLAGGVSAAGYLLLSRPAREGYQPIQPTRLFEQVFSHVRRFGVDSLPESDLYRLAANGLLGELDDEYATLLQQGSEAGLTETADVGGMGLLLAARDGRISVLSVLPGSSAELVGLAPGDQLVGVNDTQLDAGRRDQVLAALSGPAGSLAQVRVRRPGIGPLTFPVERSQPRRSLVQPARKLDNRVGYVAVRLLGPGAARSVRQGVEQLFEDGAQGLILDLRGASQGALDEGVALADLFLDPGAKLMELRGRAPEPRRWGDDQPQDRRMSGLAVVVLIDSTTADAAEITAGALQDNDRALLLGQPSFGRGLSAETFPLTEKMIVRISTGRWFTPTGRPIQRDTATSDTLEQRPRVSTARGRSVYAGGGIVPDSLVGRDTLPTTEQAFLRAVGSQFPVWRSVVSSVARLLVAGAANPEPGIVSSEARARLRAALDSAGLVVPDDTWNHAGPALDQRLGDEMVRLARGEDALLARRLRRDPVVRRAMGLLHAARSPIALVMGTGER